MTSVSVAPGQLQIGDLVHARGREWIVLAKPSDGLLRVRPLSGSEDDAILIAPKLERQPVREVSFALPNSDQLDTQDAARLLTDALRLSLRRGAGPFRSAARLGVEPRAYQLVPLLMALRLEVKRMLIADDVGIGKTIEAGMILREMLDRGEIDSFTVLCPPHLVDQWVGELAQKFDIDAVAVTSARARSLEQGIALGDTIFGVHPFTVVSLDYIKADSRREGFAQACPKFVVVDEAHSCVGGSEKGTQQRFSLLQRLVEDEARHMLLLTATPHSGNQDAYARLLSLLHPDLSRAPDTLDGNALERYRRRLAQHFVQRRRADIAGKWGESDSFAEPMKADAPYSLTGDFQVFQEDVLEYCLPTTGDVRQRLAGGNVYGPLEGAAREVAGAASVLHWPLEFPDVMVGLSGKGGGGFDVVLGNPPWERIKLQEQEFFAGHPVAEAPNAAARIRAIARLAEASEGSPDRRLYEAFQIAKRIAEATSTFARVPGDSGGRYRYTGTGDVNTYALFAEHFLNLTREGGRAGLIVPTGIATDATTAPFFGHLVSTRRLAGLIDFENREKLFADVDSRMKFCLLTLGGGGASGVAEAGFAFFLTDPAQLEQAERRFTLSPAQIARINPNTKTAPVFRARRDAELTAAIYDRVPVLIDEAKGPAGNPWGVSFMAMFHMSNDSGLFRTARQLEDEGFTREGTDWLTETGARYVPLYEGKMIHQFDHRWATYADDGTTSRDMTLAEKQNPNSEPTPRYWVPKPEVQSRLAAKGWKRGWLLSWRDITNATNERTVIAPVYPSCGVSNKLPIMFSFEQVQQIAGLVGNLSALAFDYVARQKIGGTAMNFFIYQQLPILPPSAYDEAALAFIVPRVLELTYTSHSMAPFARDLGYEGPPFAWDEDRRAALRAELDAWYALAYGLTRDELRYVLDPRDVMGPDYPSETFRVLQKNEIAKHGEYRTRRLVLGAYDELMAQGMRPRVEGYR